MQSVHTFSNYLTYVSCGLERISPRTDLVKVGTKDCVNVARELLASLYIMFLDDEQYIY